jgi:uncharacterized protein (TIGR03435 family)
MMNDDMEWLRDYAATGSDQAFQMLVSRHLSLVYTAALRQVRNPQLAEEVAQAVFIILARKAKSLSEKVILSGWLYRTTRFACADALKIQRRRQMREQEAHMDAITQSNQTDSNWEQLSPILDEAMAQLRDKDRDAIVLRFFENKNLREVGTAMGVEERAAQKRVARGLEKLRAFFAKRGVSLTAAIIATAVSAHSVQAAPAALAKTVVATTIKGAATTGSILSLIKGTLKIMAWTKVKTAILIGGAAILATSTTTLVLKKAASNTQTPNTNSWVDDPKFWELDFGDPDPQKAMATISSRNAAFQKRISSLPPVLVLRPTHFRANPGFMSEGDKIIARSRSLIELMRWAYDPTFTSQAVPPPDFPNRQQFDLMLTLQNEPRKTLQDEIKKRFGFAAHIEMIETNILSLRVKSSEAPGLQSTKGGQPIYPTKSPENKISIRNQNLSGIAACFSALLKTRVVNETGIQGSYDIALQWQPMPGESEENALKRTVLDQLGFEFVPGRKSFQYLIVEKIN